MSCSFEYSPTYGAKFPPDRPKDEIVSQKIPQYELNYIFPSSCYETQVWLSDRREDKALLGSRKYVLYNRCCMKEYTCRQDKGNQGKTVSGLAVLHENRTDIPRLHIRSTYHPHDLTALLWVVTGSPISPLVEEETPFQNTYLTRKEQRYGHGSRWGPNPRMSEMEKDIS
jgi:hypothetical protein